MVDTVELNSGFSLNSGNQVAKLAFAIGNQFVEVVGVAVVDVEPDGGYDTGGSEREALIPEGVTGILLDLGHYGPVLTLRYSR